MALRYTEETPLDHLDPVELGIRLAELVANTTEWLEGVSGLRASVPPAEGRWCAKQVLGHLADSAVNNLARIVRLETSPEVRLEPYDQEAWVEVQHYAGKEWSDVLSLWRALNLHLAWTMRQVSRESLGHRGLFPDSEATLGFLMEDYIAHIEHHLNALRQWL